MLNVLAYARQHQATLVIFQQNNLQNSFANYGHYLYNQRTLLDVDHIQPYKIN